MASLYEVLDSNCVKEMLMSKIENQKIVDFLDKAFQGCIYVTPKIWDLGSDPDSNNNTIVTISITCHFDNREMAVINTFFKNCIAFSEFDGYKTKCVLDISRLFGQLLSTQEKTVVLFKYPFNLINKKRDTATYRSWRKMVYDRDTYTCRCCGRRFGKNKKNELEAHHIKKFYNNINSNIDVHNGITLCKQCHSEGDYCFHRLYGYETTKDQLQEYIDHKRKMLRLPLFSLDDVIQKETDEYLAEYSRSLNAEYNIIVKDPHTFKTINGNEELVRNEIVDDIDDLELPFDDMDDKSDKSIDHTIEVEQIFSQKLPTEYMKLNIAVVKDYLLKMSEENGQTRQQYVLDLIKKDYLSNFDKYLSIK